MEHKIQYEKDLGRYLEPLRALPFVRKLEVRLEPGRTAERRADAEVRVKTPRRTFTLAAEFKRTYLDHATVNGVIARQAYLRGQLKTPLLLVARYIPPATGERLAQAGINFVDPIGNVHLNLGGAYHALVLGRKEAKPKLAERRTTAAMVQVACVFLVDENATKWPVRKLAEVAGVGKTAAAEARLRLIETGMLAAARGGFRIVNRNLLEEDFLAGYERVLRPGLLIGTFRPLDRDPDVLLPRFKDWADRNQVVWAATGGPAAFVLDRFYRGERVTVFLADAPERLKRELKLLAHTNGPVTILRAFGTLFPWRTQDGLPLAHPLLIYAELLHQGEPRAVEAAAQIREKYLGR